MDNGDSQQTIEKILKFWFGDPKSADFGEPKAFWFSKDDAFDTRVRGHFLKNYQDAAAAKCEHFLESAQGALALILLLDQFPRNMFRDKPEAFATDRQARIVADFMVNEGLDKNLKPIQRVFVYLPFEHSENLADQERSMELFTDLNYRDYVKWAQAHYDIIKEYGRFPHRNKILGRSNTPEEEEYLKDPNAGF